MARLLARSRVRGALATLVLAALVCAVAALAWGELRHAVGLSRS